jgi:surfeit locus 1 family protein
MTPFAVTGGGAVWVNRGFVPQRTGPGFASGGDGPAGELTLTGVARKSESVSTFTPPVDIPDRTDFVRTIDRLDTLADPALGPFAPIYVDLAAGPAGALPQGGETVVEFPNNHFGYALTWFGFAILTPCLLAFWVWRQLRPKAKG